MRIVVLGGTQFMGRLTVEALLRDGHDVVLLNRGRTANPFMGHPKLRHIKCDRTGDREGFRHALRDVGEADAVIDFTGFQEAYMQDAIDALTVEPPGAGGGGTGGTGGKRRFTCGHYVFLSTDSVYWAQKVPAGEERVGEEDARDFSPEEFERHMEHCHLTSLGEYQLRYGGNKLGCERALEEAWQADGFPFTALRLPDVYGPFDNLGGFWELVQAIEARRPVPSRLQEGRIRSPADGERAVRKGPRRFTWAFVEDVRDAILACVAKGQEVHGVTMNVGHDEAIALRGTCDLIAEALGVGPEAVRFDAERDAAVPSTDYGALDVSRALRLLRPWRPTPMRAAVTRSVRWFVSSKEHRRYHRMVHREPREYGETSVRRFACRVAEVPCCWVGSAEKASLVASGPAVLNDSLPNFIGQAVLSFMQRLMDQAGEVTVQGELQKGPSSEAQTWALRHVAGHLLPQSTHDAAYHVEAPDVLAQTDLAAELASPLADVRADDVGRPPRRVLRLGGVGARPPLRRILPSGDGAEGFWDCALLGRRKWRLFPPDTPAHALCVDFASDESRADTFVCGPDAMMVHLKHSSFAPSLCWECEQTMGDAVVVPAGWWFQTYDDDRTLSISASYGAPLVPARPAQRGAAPPVVLPGAGAGAGAAKAAEPEVIEFELVD